MVRLLPFLGRTYLGFPPPAGKKRKYISEVEKKCHDESALNGNKSLLIPGDFFARHPVAFRKGNSRGGGEIKTFKNLFYFFIRGGISSGGIIAKFKEGGRRSVLLLSVN